MRQGEPSGAARPGSMQDMGPGRMRDQATFLDPFLVLTVSIYDHDFEQGL